MAFIIHSGLYYYRVILFVQKNAGATYQRLVNMLFKDQLGKTVEVYIDGMIALFTRASNYVRDLQSTF